MEAKFLYYLQQVQNGLCSLIIQSMSGPNSGLSVGFENLPDWDWKLTVGPLNCLPFIQKLLEDAHASIFPLFLPPCRGQLKFTLDLLFVSPLLEWPYRLYINTPYIFNLFTLLIFHFFQFIYCFNVTIWLIYLTYFSTWSNNVSKVTLTLFSIARGNGSEWSIHKSTLTIVLWILPPRYSADAKLVTPFSFSSL